MKQDPAGSVDEYMSQVASDAARTSLAELRKTILEVVPEAKEVISYGIPTYKFNQTMVSFAAFKNHCSFFPGYTVAEFTEELKGYKTATGTIQFPHDQPLPKPLVSAILKARFWPSE